jgi:multidrug efflux pump
VDRERAADMGVGVDAIARAIETMLGGRIVTRYKRDGEQYDVIVQTNPVRARHARRHREDLCARQRRDTMIPLIGAGQAARGRGATRAEPLSASVARPPITANLSANYSVGEALDFMDATARKVLKPGYATDLNGIQPRVPQSRPTR